MKIRIELKTKMTNDNLHRVPSLTVVKKAVDAYSVGFKGVVVLHDSLYDYKYDTRSAMYSTVDSRHVVGNIQSSEITGEKLFLIVDVNEKFLQDSDCICFFRSQMQAVPGSNSATFDDLNIFVVDLIMIGDSEKVDEQYLSEVVILDN